MTRQDYIKACAAHVGAAQGSIDHRALIDTYNRITPLPRGYHMSYTDPWCAAFLSAVAAAGGWEDFPAECGCWHMADRLRKNGRWWSRGGAPLAGDIIFFSWSGDGVYDHVGVVERCDGSKIYTIEGNRNRSVIRYSYDIKYAGIIGYASPHYEVDAAELDTLASEVIRGRWGNGSERKKSLRAAGYDYDRIQRRVNELLK